MCQNSTNVSDDVSVTLDICSVLVSLDFLAYVALMLIDLQVRA